ncbi:hypothetical protein D9613_010249 [Agrocybe pediades]|uniref:Secreted protein n=1 Tax=Agrocybe pediades TaxID=84607 RepID=A0A8H4QFM2_9AGAR|nr:hypothetical protein D9613_010249 [Agrocybe pediades]
MQLKLTPLFALITLLSTTPALSYRVTTTGYSNTVACQGAALVCFNHNANTCCWMPVGYGFSVKYTGMPRGSTGQGYRNKNSCYRDRSRLFTVYSDGTKCWSSGGFSRASWLKWNLPHPTTFMRIEGAGKESMAGCDVVEPDVFRYHLPDGGMRAIKIPKAKGSAQEVVDLHAAGDYEALEEYEEHNGEHKEHEGEHEENYEY